jgi:iron complex outermembrane recepter protein
LGAKRTARVGLTAAVFALGAMGQLPALGADGATTVAVDIESQPLEGALVELSKQGHIQLVVSTTTLPVKVAGPLHGRLALGKALELLLKGTGLTYRFVGEQTVAIVQSPAPTSQSTPVASPSDGAPASAGVASATTVGAAAGTSPENSNRGDQKMKKGTLLARLASLIGLCASAASPGTACADQADSDNGAAGNLQEIVVTAQKRSEHFQDVPLSISVLSGSQLTATQTNTLQDIVNSVPGVQLISTSPVENEIVIRGISVDAGVNSSVATYVDEVPYTSEGPFAFGTAIAPNLDTYDLSRIEVLRGPQGTLYGANALGGLIKYVTNAPDPTRFGASVLVGGSTVQNGGEGYEAHAMVNMPLSDTAALRLVGGDTYFPGFIDDPSRGRSDINDIRRESGRASLLWDPVEQLDIRLSASYQRLQSGDTGREDLLASTLQPVYGDLIQERLLPQPQSVTDAIYNATIKWNPGVVSAVSSTSFTKANPNVLFDVSSELGSFLSSTFGGHYGAVEAASEPVHSLTEELRLSSSDTQIVDWTVGGFYTDEAAQELEPLYAYNLTTQMLLPGFQPALGTYYIDSTYREYAGFADVNYHLTQAFEVGVGGRYSTNSQTYHQVNSGLFTGTNDFWTDSSQDVFTYSVDAKYRFNPNTVAYARVASGFVPGGPNDAIPGSNLPPTFHSSTTTNYELGVKGSAAGGRVIYDADIFDVEWRDIQLFAVFGDFAGITNGGRARSQGVEGGVHYVPVTGLTVSFNGAYTNARLTQDTPASFGGLAGAQLPLTPYFAGTLGAAYERPLWANVSGFGGIDWHYDGSRLSDFLGGGAPRVVLPSYSLVNLRAGLKLPSYTFTAYVKNAGNVRAINSVTAEPGSSPAALSAAIATPRTIGVTIAASF